MEWYTILIFVSEAVAIVLANSSTIIVFVKSRRLRRKQYIMIISQAVADLFIGLVSIPVYIVFRNNKNNDIIEKSHRIQDGYFGFASLFGLAAMSIERAHATYFPFRHSSLGIGPYIFGTILMWILPLIAVIANILHLPKVIAGNIRWATICLILVLISTAYSLIVWKVRTNSFTVSSTNTQENKKLTVTLALVTTISIVMWVPYQCFVFVHVNYPSHDAATNIFYAKFLHYGNSLVNPIIYAFRMRAFKTEIRNILTNCLRKNRISTMNASELRDTI